LALPKSKAGQFFELCKSVTCRRIDFGVADHFLRGHELLQEGISL